MIIYCHRTIQILYFFQRDFTHETINKLTHQINITQFKHLRGTMTFHVVTPVHIYIHPCLSDSNPSLKRDLNPSFNQPQRPKNLTFPTTSLVETHAVTAHHLSLLLQERISIYIHSRYGGICSPLKPSFFD